MSEDGGGAGGGFRVELPALRQFNQDMQGELDALTRQLNGLFQEKAILGTEEYATYLNSRQQQALGEMNTLLNKIRQGTQRAAEAAAQVADRYEEADQRGKDRHDRIMGGE